MTPEEVAKLPAGTKGDVMDHSCHIIYKRVLSGQERFYYAFRCSCGAGGRYRVTEARAEEDAARHRDQEAPNEGR